jgi:hypothetical protein
MLKISPAGANGQNSTLKLEGRIVGPWVNELRLVSDLLLSNGRAMRLDLMDVSYADAEGVKLLLNLKSRGVMLFNGSPFVAEQLKTFGPA